MTSSKVDSGFFNTSSSVSMLGVDTVAPPLWMFCLLPGVSGFDRRVDVAILLTP